MSDIKVFTFTEAELKTYVKQVIKVYQGNPGNPDMAVNFALVQAEGLKAENARKFGSYSTKPKTVSDETVNILEVL